MRCASSAKHACIARLPAQGELLQAAVKFVGGNREFGKYRVLSEQICPENGSVVREWFLFMWVAADVIRLQ